MQRSFSMLMGRRSSGGEVNHQEPQNEFTRPVRTNTRAERPVHRFSLTRMAVSQLADDEKNFNTNRMHNIKVNVLISELKHRIEGVVLKQFLDLIVDLALERGYKHRSLLNDCVELIVWIQSNSQLSALLHDPTCYVKYARIYFELCKSEGITYPIQYLEASKHFFELHFKENENWPIPDDYVEYIRLLIVCGDFVTAAEIVTILLTKFENDEKYANYLFYAGAIFKELKDLERANNYLFESVEVGPPKFFSKIEMMTVISRILEEVADSQAVTDVFAEGADSEDAYRIVHQQLVLEGSIDEETEYDDWVNDAATWIVIADKCAMHEMHSLATEFYMLAISKDMEAYKKPMLWFRFAKSSFRCGRIDDAKLAIKQAMTKAPFNTQLRRTQLKWMARERILSERRELEYTTAMNMKEQERLHQIMFETEQAEQIGKTDSKSSKSPLSPKSSKDLTIEEAAGSKVPPLTPQKRSLAKQLSMFAKIDFGELNHETAELAATLYPILDKVKEHMGTEDVILAKIQAFIRGSIERTHFLLGYEKGGKMRRLSAKIGVVLSATNSQQENFHYPIFIRVKPSWMGMIRLIHVHDVSNDRNGIIKLKLPFAPMKDVLRRQTTKITLECQKIVTHHDLEHPKPAASPDDYASFDSPEGNNEYGNDDISLLTAPKQEYCFLIMKFTDITQESSYYYRRLLLKYDETKKTISHGQYKANTTLITVIENFNEGKLNEILRLQEEQELLAKAREKNLSSIPRLINLPNSAGNSVYSATISAYSTALRSLSTGAGEGGMGGGGGAGDDGTSTVLSSILEHKIFLESQTSTELVVTRTTIFRRLILRDIYHEKLHDQYYLITLLNSHDVTQLSFLQYSTNKVFTFFMLREFIDRGQRHFKKKWLKFLSILITHPLLAIVVNPKFQAQDIVNSPLLSPLLLSPKDPPKHEEEGKMKRLSHHREMMVSPSSGIEEITEFGLPLTNYLTGHVKILPKQKGANIILIHQHHKPILAESFEVYEDPTGAHAEESIDGIKFNEGKSLQSLLFPILSKQPSYQQEFFQDVMQKDYYYYDGDGLPPTTEEEEGGGVNTEETMMMNPALAAIADSYSMIVNEDLGTARRSSIPSLDVLEINREEFPLYHVPEEQHHEQDYHDGEELQGLVAGKSLTESSSIYQDSDMTGLRIGGIFDQEESESVVIPDKDNNNNNAILFNDASLDIASIGGGGTGETKPNPNQPLSSPNASWNINQLMQNLKEQEEIKEAQRFAELKEQEQIRQRKEEERMRIELARLIEQQRLEREEAERKAAILAAERLQIIQEFAKVYSINLIDSTERKLISEDFMDTIFDYVCETIVHRSVRSFITLRTAKFVSTVTVATSTTMEGLIESFTREGIESIIQEEISWDILLQMFFNFLMHILLKEVVQDGIHEIEKEIEEKIRLEEILEAKKNELRKKAYYPRKIRSMVNEQSHYLLHQKDPSLVPINAWTEEFSVLSTNSPTRPTKTMSAVRHREHARAVVFHNDSPVMMGQHSSNNNNGEEEKQQKPRPMSSSAMAQFLPRPKTSSSVKQVSSQVYTSPKALVKALRTNTSDLDFDSPQSRPSTPKESITKAPPIIVTSDNVHPHILHPPILPKSLTLELQTVDGFDPKSKDFPLRILRPATAAAVLVKSRQPSRASSPRNEGSIASLSSLFRRRSVSQDKELKKEEEEIKYLPDPTYPSDSTTKRPATTQQLTIYKDKDVLYEGSLKQIHRLGFAPSERSHATVDLADGQPTRRAWEYTTYWQQLLTAFIKYHANLPSIKVTLEQQQQEKQNGKGINLSKEESMDKILSTSESIDEIQQISHAYGFVEKEAFEVFKDRPAFWLLKKQIAILHRAIPPERYHSIRLHYGFPHLPRYELIKTKRLHYASPTTTAIVGPTNNEVGRKKTGEDLFASLREPTVEQLICCLAECRGSVGEVIQKVYQLEFMKEIELVCDAINVRALICSVSSDAEVLFPKAKKDHSLSPKDRKHRSTLSSSPPPKKQSSPSRYYGSNISSPEPSMVWQDSSIALEKIIHQRNEETKMYYRTKQRDHSRERTTSTDSIASSSARTTKVIRRNSSLVLTDYESDESFVVALQKILNRNVSTGNTLQQSLLVFDENDDSKEKLKDPGSVTGITQTSGSHVPTGLMILPRVGSKSGTTLDRNSLLLRSRASFVSGNSISHSITQRTGSVTEGEEKSTRNSFILTARGGEETATRQNSNPRTSSARGSASFVTKVRQHSAKSQSVHQSMGEEDIGGGDSVSLMIGFPENSLELPEAIATDYSDDHRIGKSRSHSRHGSPKLHGRGLVVNISEPFNSVTRASPSPTHKATPTTTPTAGTAKPSRKASYHFEEFLIEEAFRSEEAHEFTILSRRDAMKIEKEETLLKSNKLYIREPVERKIEMLSRRLSSIHNHIPNKTSASFFVEPNNDA